jgi:sodium-independent organic anion transporter
MRSAGDETTVVHGGGGDALPVVMASTCYEGHCGSKQGKGSIKCAFAFICSIVCIQSMVMSGLFAAGLSSVERQFGFTSVQAGAMGSIYETGVIVMLPIVTYFGKNFPQLKVLAAGAFIIGIGKILFALPQFVSEEYVPGGALRNEICDDISTSTECKSSSSLYGLFAFSMLVLAIGASPLYPLATTYLESHTDRSKFSMYLGIMYAFSAVGPAIGFLASGFTLAVWNDLGDAPDGLTDEDPSWVGAWWFLFIFFGLMLMMIAAFLWFYPESEKVDADVSKAGESRDTERGNELEIVMSSAGVDMENDVNESKDDCTEAKGLDLALGGLDPPRRQSSMGEVAAAQHLAPTMSELDIGKPSSAGEHPPGAEPRPNPSMKAMTKSLATNAPFVCATLGAACDMFIVSGGSTFLPKIIQSMFGLTSGDASFLIGATLVPGAAGGFLLGGVIMSKIKRTDSKMNAKVCLVASVLCTLSCFFLLALCSSQPYAGVNTDIGTQAVSELPFGMATATCNVGCACDSVNVYTPSCGDDGNIYFNPCLAGCTKEKLGDDGQPTSWSNCGCVGGDGTLVPDKCESDCGLLPVYLAGIMIVMVGVFVNNVPGHNVTLRVVKANEKEYAMGISQGAVRMLGSITAPIIWGSLMDKSCLMWDYTCDGEQNSCWEYDPLETGMRVFWLCFIAKCFATLCFFGAYRTADRTKDN